VHRARPRPLSLATPAAFGLLVALETILVRALSLGHQVAPVPLILGHVFLITLVVWTRPSRAALPSHELRFRLKFRLWPTVVALPLLVLVSLSLVRYAPNNLDALNYHLPRVAFWMQNRSVALYPTTILQQNGRGAGAEYLLLVFQSISRTDRLTGLLQLVCAILIVCSAPALARLGGSPAKVARWAWLFPITLPMAVTQATSGQNDLVAAALSIGCVVALLPFFHPGEKRTPSWGDAGIAGLTLGAAVTTKVTAIVPVLPLLLLAIAVQVSRVVRSHATIRGETIGRGMLVGALGLLLIGLESDRPRAEADFPSYLKEYAYVGTSEWEDRAINSVRGVFRELPAPWLVSRALHLTACPQGKTCLLPLRPHEDLVGQPIHALAMLVLFVLLAMRWRHLATRTQAFTVSLAIGWLIFHALLRDNAWIARLHLPLFALAPLGFGVLQGLVLSPGFSLAARLLAVLAVLDALAVAVRNERRPPLGPVSTYVASYYEPHIEWMRAGHERALAATVASDCRNLAIANASPDCEYPLVWRAMQAGVTVRHFDKDDSRACLVYRSRNGAPPPAETWIPLESEPAEASVYRRR
jgi:hypothetical protein